MESKLTIRKVFSYVIGVLRQIFWPYDVYQRNEEGEIVYKREHGKELPISNTLASVIAKIASLIIATVGAIEILGLPVAEWLYILFGVAGLSTILGL